MRNMSRIRNTLRFQSPEERVLNGLLALVLVVLISVGIAKVRDDRVEAASEVKGITVTREQPVRAGVTAAVGAGHEVPSSNGVDPYRTYPMYESSIGYVRPVTLPP